MPIFLPRVFSIKNIIGTSGRSLSVDVAVIGGGPGGYVAALRAAKLGLKTTCVEKEPLLGGTCLNVGCIPSKSLLFTAEMLDHCGSLSRRGVEVREVKFDLGKAMKEKSRSIRSLSKGIDLLFKTHGVNRIKGTATVLPGNRIKVSGSSSQDDLKAKHIIIATGSEPVPLPGVEFDEEVIVSSTGALSFKNVPKHLVVIGAGVIGLELGSVWRKFGSKVTVVEYLDRITPGVDSEIAAELQRKLRKEGIKFVLGSKVEKIKKKSGGASIYVSSRDGNNKTVIDADAVLVAIGRRPVTKGLGLDELGVKMDKCGFIKIDRRSYQTSRKGLHAIGDVVPGPMLAHKASEEGVACVEKIAKLKNALHVNYSAIPGVIYTDPEVATVGMSQEDAVKAGLKVSIGRFPFSGNSRSKAVGSGFGLAKVVADAKNDRLLGVHVIGPHAGEMIHASAFAIENGNMSRDLGNLCHAHPTFSEAVKEAALDVTSSAVHK